MARVASFHSLCFLEKDFVSKEQSEIIRVFDDWNLPDGDGERPPNSFANGVRRSRDKRTNPPGRAAAEHSVAQRSFRLQAALKVVVRMLLRK